MGKRRFSDPACPENAYLKRNIGFGWIKNLKNLEIFAIGVNMLLEKLLTNSHKT